MLPLLLLITYISSCYGNGLQFTLHQRKSECFYFERAKGEKLQVMFAVADGISLVSFAIFSPDKEDILYRKMGVRMGEYDAIINKTGDYACCFTGQKLTSSVNVHFDFESEIEEKVRQEAGKKLNAEKKIFLNRVLKNINLDEEINKKKFNITEQFMIDVVRSHKELVADQNPDSTMQNSMLYISILADSMLNSMKKHRIKSRSHHYMQESNQVNVDIFSTLISLAILVSACIQIIVVKSFFTGSISLKIWQF